ncbi:MAG: MFS transporter [Vulcanimicrobiaceae bacterium]
MSDRVTSSVSTEVASMPLVGAPVRSDGIPRWLLATIVLLSLSVFINYIDRGNLSTAAPVIKDELNISATQLGFLLTSFFVTYALMQPVAGWLADRFGAGPVLLTGFVIWSAATCLTGFAQGFGALLALRLLLGGGESVAFPSYAKILVRCFPERRRGTASAAIMAAMASGPAFGTFVGGMLIATYGWRSFFIGFGLVSLLWIVPWVALAQKPLAANASGTETKWSPSFGAILRERSLWGASIGQFCSNFVWYFVLTWIPFYLVHERHWSLREMAVIGGAAYLLMAVSAMMSGWLEDRWIGLGASATRVRKTFLGAGALGVAAFLIGCVASDAGHSVLFLMLACIAIGMVVPNILCVAQSLAGPVAAGRWMGVQNGLGNTAGIVAPALTGILVDRTGTFLAPFTIAAVISLLGAFAWVFVVGQVSQIDWSHTRDICA